MGTVLYFAAIMGFFYFVLIRPNQKKQKQLSGMREALKSGDRVVTIGGMKGRVVRVKEDEVVLDVSGNEITFQKWGIGKLEE